MKKTFNMAKLNHKGYKYSQKNICINIIMSSLLFLLITSLGWSTSKLFSNYQNDNPYYREIRLSTVNDFTQRNPLSDVQLVQLSMIDNIEDMFVHYELRSIGNTLKIVIDGVYLNTLFVNGSDVRYSFLPTGFIRQRSNNQNMNSIISGRMFNSFDTKKAVIDENYAYILGYQTVDDILNKKISLQFDGVVVNDIEIVGVHDWRLGGGNLTAPDYNSSGQINRKLNNIQAEEKKEYLKENSLNFSPCILSHDIIQEVANNLTVKDFDKNHIGQHNIRILSNSVSNVTQVAKNISNITDNYIDSDIVAIEQRVKAIADVRIFVTVIAFGLLFVALVSIINTLIIKIQSQKGLINLMQKIGYSKQNIRCIYMIDSLLLLLKAAIITTTISIITTIFIDMILMQSYSLFSTLDQFVFIINPILLIGYFLILAVVIGLASILVVMAQMHKKWVIKI